MSVTTAVSEANALTSLGSNLYDNNKFVRRFMDSKFANSKLGNAALTVGGQWLYRGAKQARDAEAESSEVEQNDLARKNKLADIYNKQVLATYPSQGVRGVTSFKYGGMMNGGTMKSLSSDVAKFYGDSHEQGGINLSNGAEVEGNETVSKGRIYSDTLPVGEELANTVQNMTGIKIDGSYADASQAIAKYQKSDKVKGKFAKQTQNIIDKRSQEALDMVFDEQESSKTGNQTFKYGGKMKYYDGGIYNDPPRYDPNDPNAPAIINFGYLPNGKIDRNFNNYDAQGNYIGGSFITNPDQIYSHTDYDTTSGDGSGSVMKMYSPFETPAEAQQRAAKELVAKYQQPNITLPIVESESTSGKDNTPKVNPSVKTESNPYFINQWASTEDKFEPNDFARDALSRRMNFGASTPSVKTESNPLPNRKPSLTGGLYNTPETGYEGNVIPKAAVNLSGYDELASYHPKQRLPVSNSMSVDTGVVNTTVDTNPITGEKINPPTVENPVTNQSSVNQSPVNQNKVYYTVGDNQNKIDGGKAFEGTVFDDSVTLDNNTGGNVNWSALTRFLSNPDTIGQIANLATYGANKKSIDKLDTTLEPTFIPAARYRYIDRSGANEAAIEQSVSNAINRTRRTSSQGNAGMIAGIKAKELAAKNQNAAQEGAREDAAINRYMQDVARVESGNVGIANRANEAENTMFNQKVGLGIEARNAFLQGVQANLQNASNREADLFKVAVVALRQGDTGTFDRAAQELIGINPSFAKYLPNTT